MGKQLTSAGVLAAILLSACGGGSGGGNQPVDPIVNMLGKAAKGIVANAPVEICPAGVASGAASCLTGVTDANGDYSITITQPFALPAIVTLTAAANTTVRCDVVAGCGEADFGEDFPAPSDFRLRTVVATLATSTVNAPVTPFTDAIVERAMTSGGVTAANVAMARSFVSSALGLTGAEDVLTLAPVDVTDATALAAAGAQQHDYSLFLAGVAANNAANPKTAVDALSAAFAAGLPQADYQQLVASTRTQSEGLSSPQRAGLVAVAGLQADNTGEGGFTPPPPVNTDAVAQAKSAVAQLRMLFNDLSNLEAPLEAVAPQVEAAALAAESNEALLASLFDVIDVTFADTERLQPEGSVSCFEGPQQLSDTEFEVDVTLTCSVDSEAEKRSLSISGTAASYAVTNLKLTLTENAYALLVESQSEAPPPSQGEEPLVVSEQLNSKDLVLSEQEAGFEAIGFNISLEEIRQTVGPMAQFVITDGGIVLNIDQGALFDLVDDNDVSVIRSISLDVLARAEFAVPAPTNSAFFEGEFRVAASSADAEVAPSLDSLRFAGTIGIDNAEAQASIDFTPDAEAAGPDGLKGRLTLTLDTSGIPNVPALKLVATGRALQFVDDGDAIEAELVLTLLRDGAQAVRVQYLGGDRFDIEALDLDPRFVVTVGSGNSAVTLVYREVDGNEIEGRITVGNDEVALVSSTRGSPLLIRYSDGSFESVF